MQVNGTRVLTYADFVKGLDPKGNFAHRIVELVAKKVEMLDDMTVIEANDGSALSTTVRTDSLEQGQQGQDQGQLRHDGHQGHGC